MSGDYAFIADYWGLAVISIADPENPEQVGYYDTPQYSNHVTVSGDYAYLVARYGGLRIIDISDPENMEEVGYLDSFDYAMRLSVSGDYAYVVYYPAFNHNINEWFGGGLRIIDISDPAQPIEVGYYNSSLHGSAETWDVTVSGDYAYLADRGIGLCVLSVTDPENPRLVGYHRTSGPKGGISVGDDGLILMTYGYVGIYRFTDPAEVSDDPNNIIPTEFSLSEPYPNPFNSTTTISYSIPIASQLSLQLYNLSGRSVITLFDGYREAGNHSTTLTATDLPSGLYFVNLEASEQTLTRKIMLIK
ncbi:MAG: T9SS type A sorting domain-containing protein [Candidatus Electryoneaceae bacterium]|nr:T9SS type A sorting domain-containing protein [Candidatus Electryoneaceae bacterium]